MTRRDGHRALVGAIAACGLALTAGCALNAGYAANDQFEEHMAGVEGVTGAEGHLTNTLPFGGSGSVSLWLDADADRDVLVAAAQRAADFSPGWRVNASVDRIELAMGWGEPLSADEEYASSVLVTVEESEVVADAVHTLLSLRALPGIVAVYGNRSPDDVYLEVGPAADPCSTATAVESALDIPGGSIDEIDVSRGGDDPTWVERRTCA